MWPITPEEALILSGLTYLEFYRRVKRAKGAAEIAMTCEGAKVYRLQRGQDWGYGLGGSAHDGSDTRKALERLHTILVAQNRMLTSV